MDVVSAYVLVIVNWSAQLLPASMESLNDAPKDTIYLCQ